MNKISKIKNLLCFLLIISFSNVFGYPFFPNQVSAETHWKKLDLRHKIAQLIMVRINGKFYNSESYYKRNLKRWISEDGVGGIIAFTGSVHGTFYNIKDFQSWADIPLLVASDLERGLGQMMNGATLFPTNMAVAATQDTSLAYKQGIITANEALSIGTHIVFAPVMDVNNNPENPIINFRAYSDNPKIVADFGTSFIRGIQDGGVIACAKHYPGHGNTSTDSHTSLPTIDGSREELNKMELYPFKKAIESDVGMIMVGHIGMPGLDPSGTSSSQSKLIMDMLLKDEMGFNGIVVTDALEMGGITKISSSGEACVRAIEAGADIILLPLDVKAAIDAVYDAVMLGRISENRIDESVEKIWNLKSKLGLLNNYEMQWSAVEDNIGLTENKNTAQFIANRSITLVKNDKNLIPLKGNKLKKITHLILTTDDGGNDMLKSFHKDLSRTHGNVKKMTLDYELDDRRINAIIEDVRGSSVVIVSMLIRIYMDKGKSTIDESHANLLQRLKDENIPTVGISFGSPYLPSYDSLDAYLCAYGYGGISLKAAANAIWGRSSIQGKLPVKLNDEYRRGHGIVIKTKKFSFRQSAKKYNFDLAWDVLNRGIESEIFPGAQVVVLKDHKIVAEMSFGKYTYSENARPVDSNTIYDVASVTKVLSVMPIAMKLIEFKKLSLEHTLEQYYPTLYNKKKGKISIRNLLTHSSGFKDYIEFYKIDASMKRVDIVDEILNLDLEYNPGEQFVYSDLGIIILMDIIEKITYKSIDELCKKWVFKPLEMSSTFYNPEVDSRDAIAPTELDNYFRHRLLVGEVHDENAYLLGGISGHAGIFSNAYDLAKFGQLFINGGSWRGNRLFSSSQVKTFTTRQNIPEGSDRALGWDTPNREGRSSAGDLFSEHSYGHTGFTGTSIWIDKQNNLVVVLLTNRVYPSREKKGMYSIRRDFHTQIMKAIL